ncbi:MAG TPA: YhjD/YihY/BrkB family envelope integrity protein [Candidatus Binatia bacterium]|nr:YhjD/YihY/BrkB family envelope integrity protein [Candidatus Binatia bacterium]
MLAQGARTLFVRLLFALIYKFVPDIRIQWKDVSMGAALTSILFTIGKFFHWALFRQ